MQIPAEYGEDYIVLAISVGLATIGVCVFSAVYFGSRTFLFYQIYWRSTYEKTTVSFTYIVYDTFSVLLNLSDNRFSGELSTYLH